MNKIQFIKNNNKLILVIFLLILMFGLLIANKIQNNNIEKLKFNLLNTANALEKAKEKTVVEILWEKARNYNNIVSIKQKQVEQLQIEINNSILKSNCYKGQIQYFIENKEIDLKYCETNSNLLEIKKFEG